MYPVPLEMYTNETWNHQSNKNVPLLTCIIKKIIQDKINNGEDFK